MTEVTIGIDIGTTSVKAAAVDADGRVVARARVPHEVRAPEPHTFEHDAVVAWRDGPRRALAQLGRGHDVRGIGIAAMVPSMTAVDADGTPMSPGLLYGDHRGGGGVAHASPVSAGEAKAFLEWTATRWPDARGYWPAQAVAAVALGADPVIDLGVAAGFYPLFTGTWDPAALAEVGVRVEQLPATALTDGSCVSHIDGVPMAAGGADAMAEQIVAGADQPGDVLVICGTTLIIWATVPEWREVPGLWSIPHSAPGLFCIGGPSNAGGLFLNWVRRVLAPGDPAEVPPGRVPVWTPYLRGERSPFHDVTLRAAIDGLDLGHDAAAIRRAAYEASGFVVRHHLDLSGVAAGRLVATGGGVLDPAWMQALADCTGVPVHCAEVPEGAALGMAWLGRMTGGLETALTDARRWARTGHVYEPDPRWEKACGERYERFRELGEARGPAGRPAAGLTARATDPSAARAAVPR